MCITFFYINNSNLKKPKFIILFNREEFKERQTKPLDFLDEN